MSDRNSIIITLILAVASCADFSVSLLFPKNYFVKEPKSIGLVILSNSNLPPFISVHSSQGIRSIIVT